jgi:hypothetical protein
MLPTYPLTGDWKAHKFQCKIAAQGASGAQPRAAPVGSSTQLNELLRVGAKYTIYDESMALGLDPSLISGARCDHLLSVAFFGVERRSSGAEFYNEKDGMGNFWRLEAPVREQWEAKAQVHNRKSQRFWTSYLAPIR